MAEHTPAPWWYADGKIGVGAHPDHAYIARLNTWPDSAEEQAANGRLIAAAPDLLAALKGVVAVADRATVEFDAARAAIAKAETPVSR